MCPETTAFPARQQGVERWDSDLEGQWEDFLPSTRNDFCSQNALLLPPRAPCPPGAQGDHSTAPYSSPGTEREGLLSQGEAGGVSGNLEEEV